MILRGSSLLIMLVALFVVQEVDDVVLLFQTLLSEDRFSWICTILLDQTDKF